MGVWCCQITLSAPITKAHTNSRRFNKKSCVVICGRMRLKHAEGMSLRYDEIAAFETLFRATFV